MFPIAGLKYCGDAVHLLEAERCIIENNRFYFVESIHFMLNNGIKN